MTAGNPSTLSELEKILIDETGAIPLYKRYRALFSLKGLGTKEAIQSIIKATEKENRSELFKHELAYCLGQLQSKEAVPLLLKLIADPNEFVMVRHEAAEAIGAISDKDNMQFLGQYLKDPCQELADTCFLAIKKIEYENSSQDIKESNDKQKHQNIYGSIDPTPPEMEANSIEELEKKLLNESLCLWDRYKAMFRLRDIGTDEAVRVLSTALLTDKTSALFRHEIGFIFGELQHPLSVPALQQALADTQEAPMVRHEAAEALGSIASVDIIDILESYLQDEADVIRESCVVALDMYNHQNSDEFQYAIIPQ
ncbi:hypothetical protein BB561_001346 [Smittium simulii]|uniref:Deoxyhypusine hydroxylase n=1 Tax=Smittium simulii TaxID=133385 RepID=A0A2T9YV69_9FUNG|nr:hypothetical protein BB561_001346 [Smittium simulii]